MLYRGADTVRDLEWVVFDEVHCKYQLSTLQYLNFTSVIAYMYLLYRARDE
jgi:hypothetical protein